MQTKLELNKVHEFKKKPDGQGFYLAKTNPAIRLSCDTGVLFIQGGQVFSEEGGAIPADKLPGWFKGELEKCTPAALREVGWKDLPAKGK